MILHNISDVFRYSLFMRDPELTRRKPPTNQLVLKRLQGLGNFTGISRVLGGSPKLCATMFVLFFGPLNIAVNTMTQYQAPPKTYIY